MSSSDTHVNQSATRDSSAPPGPPLSSPTIGTAPVRSLARAVFERRNDYLTRQSLRVKIGSWNVAALDGTEKDLKSWFVEGKGVSAKLAGLRLNDGRGEEGSDETIESVAHQERRATKVAATTPHNDPGIFPDEEDVGLYVLGLQEIIDISSATGTILSYNDSYAARKWREAVSDALPAGYTCIAEQQLVGLYLNIFASAEVAKTISSVSTISIGTGLMGYMGNKGAVAARVVVGEVTKMVFINSHLAAGNDKGTLERRNWDAAQISQRTKFDPVDHGNGIIEESNDSLGEEHFTFWFGDLNYRLGSIPGDDVRRLLMLHTRNEYDTKQESIESLVKIDHELNITSENDAKSQFVVADDGEEEDALDPENDPASLQTTLSSLLPHDQLHEQMRTDKAFHEGWREGPLKFLPTYKYDVGSVGMFDSSEKRRGPSWCDRILFRTQKDYLRHLRKTKDAALAQKKDAEMKARGLHEGPEETVLFDYNPDTDGTDDLFEVAEAAHGEEIQQPSDSEDDDSLSMQYYTSHQRVLSSDHKPLNALFDLTFDAADLSKKAEISAAAAKELDRDENEARPTLTLIFDQIDAKKDDKNELDFGRVSFDEPKVRHITIANTGSVIAHFGMIQDDVPGSQQRQWVVLRVEGAHSSESLHRTSHSLHPGETMNITCTLHITNFEDVRALNYGQASMEDVQILRVQDGRDYFITSRFKWLNSCFGLSLEKLIRVPERGVRSCRLDSQLNEQQVRWSAPRELFRLTETLEEVLERAVAEWRMKEEVSPPPWETAGWPFLATTWTFLGEERQTLKHNIRDTLDLGANFALNAELSPISKTEALAETLLTFLDSIDDGIINGDLWTSLSNALQEREKVKKHLDADATRALILEEISVSPARSVAFTFITFMLARVANEVAPVPNATGPDTSSPVAKASELLKKGIRRSGGTESFTAKRREVEKHFAEVMAGVIFKLPSEMRSKEKRAGEERRRNVVGIFLHSKTDDRAL